MPEAGYLPIPKKLAAKGVKDMVRVSDARMSGTAVGTIVLHVTPDSASGGPLCLEKTGDRIRLSVKQRRIDLMVDDAELKRRSAESKRAVQPPERGRGGVGEGVLRRAATGVSATHAPAGAAGGVIDLLQEAGLTRA